MMIVSECSITNNEDTIARDSLHLLYYLLVLIAGSTSTGGRVWETVQLGICRWRSIVWDCTLVLSPPRLPNENWYFGSWYLLVLLGSWVDWSSMPSTQQYRILKYDMEGQETDLEHDHSIVQSSLPVDDHCYNLFTSHTSNTAVGFEHTAAENITRNACSRAS